LLAIASYFAFFHVIRLVPLVGAALFAVAAILLVSGLKRAYEQPQLYRGKVAGRVLASLSVAVLAVFCLCAMILPKHFAKGLMAPRIGDRAPGFTLADARGNHVALAGLLSAPMIDSAGAAHVPKGVLLIFYRGYW